MAKTMIPVFLVGVLALYASGCGGQAQATVTPVPIATLVPTSTPAATAPPTQTPEPTPSPAPFQATLPLGSEGWWGQVAPCAAYREATPTLAGLDGGDAICSLYAAVFVASEWISGREPNPRRFADFVRSLPDEMMPSEAYRLFSEIRAVDPDTASWARPYLHPEVTSEFSLLGNLAFAACLSIKTWDECYATLTGG